MSTGSQVMVILIGIHMLSPTRKPHLARKVLQPSWRQSAVLKQTNLFSIFLISIH